MIFWRTHWAFSVDWDEWNTDRSEGRWVRRFIHFGDYETAQQEWDRVKALPPGQTRDICMNRRPVGVPAYFMRSS